MAEKVFLMRESDGVYTAATIERAVALLRRNNVEGDVLVMADDSCVIAPSAGSGRWIKVPTERERLDAEMKARGMNRHERRAARARKRKR